MHRSGVSVLATPHVAPHPHRTSPTATLVREGAGGFLSLPPLPHLLLDGDRRATPGGGWAHVSHSP
jgi:hypothetical protein